MEAIQSGTKNWQPDQLPANETEETVEAKRLILCTIDFTKINYIQTGTEEDKLLQSTFATQRLFLNNIDNIPTIKDIKQHLPFLLTE